jgi:hypothetical protein
MLFKTLRKGVLARFIVGAAAMVLAIALQPLLHPSLATPPPLPPAVPAPSSSIPPCLQSCPKPRLLIPPASRFSEGLASVRIVTPDTHRVGYIDSSGRVVIQPQFDYADDFSEGLAAVTIGTKSGYIDKTGKIAIKSQFGLKR